MNEIDQSNWISVYSTQQRKGLPQNLESETEEAGERTDETAEKLGEKCGNNMRNVGKRLGN